MADAAARVQDARPSRKVQAVKQLLLHAPERPADRQHPPRILLPVSKVPRAAQDQPVADSGFQRLEQGLHGGVVTDYGLVLGRRGGGSGLCHVGSPFADVRWCTVREEAKVRNETSTEQCFLIKVKGLCYDVSGRWANKSQVLQTHVGACRWWAVLPPLPVAA